jgi:hypothetical protein
MRELIILIEALIGTAFVGGILIITTMYFGYVAGFIAGMVALYLFFKVIDYIN